MQNVGNQASDTWAIGNQGPSVDIKGNPSRGQVSNSNTTGLGQTGLSENKKLANGFDNSWGLGSEHDMMLSKQSKVKQP